MMLESVLRASRAATRGLATPAASATSAPTPAPSPIALDFTRLPARGPNPVACLPACSPFGATPLNRTSLDGAAARWRDQSIACLETSGPASGATHHAQILANERTELTAEAEELRTARRRPSEYRSDLVHVCERKRREIELEYQYNVIFANDNPRRRWHTYDLDHADRGLAAIPPEMTWGNPVVMTFRRGSIHPTSPGVGGETDARNLAATGAASIEIFDAGLAPGRFGWAAAVGPERPLHTFRHEVGHVIEEQIPRAARNELWSTLMDWREFPWAWISAPNAPGTPSEWIERRNEVKRLTGLSDDAAYDAWLAALTEGVLVDVNGRPWARQTHSSSPFLITWRNGAIPRIREFQYARTGQQDYFAEVYTYAVSQPDWLHDVLPPDQIIWFKRNVFHVPATETEWATQLATTRPVSPTAFARLMRTFTWTQAQPVIRAAMLEHVA